MQRRFSNYLCRMFRYCTYQGVKRAPKKYDGRLAAIFHAANAVREHVGLAAGLRFDAHITCGRRRRIAGFGNRSAANQREKEVHICV
jgi:hypothetical protein